MDNTSVDIFVRSGWNDSLYEETNFTVPDNMNRTIPRIVNLFTFIITTTNIVIACVATVLNACLLRSLSKVSNGKLKSKRFLQSNSIANIILPVAHAIDLPYLGEVLWPQNLSLMQCFSGFYFTIFILTSFSQAACSIGLALDRVYAVTRPLQYHTVGYSKLFRGFMVAFPWLTAMMIWTAVFVTSLGSLTPLFNSEILICKVLFHTYFVAWQSMTIDAVLITLNSVSFCVHMGIFLIVKYQMLKTKHDNISGARKMTLSLVITYSFINIITLAFYLPTPLYSALNQHMSQDENTRVAFMSTLMALIAVYMCNSFLDPIILMFRIQPIRDELPFKRTPKRSNVSATKPTTA